mmetsp:Transcript_102669/g.296825  ORF Transcript_102669/g.296825 Transcript_102669/m.296825 type:complete len:315 (+) Transcript_102669:1170-2114(+)
MRPKRLEKRFRQLLLHLYGALPSTEVEEDLLANLGDCLRHRDRVENAALLVALALRRLRHQLFARSLRRGPESVGGRGMLAVLLSLRRGLHRNLEGLGVRAHLPREQRASLDWHAVVATSRDEPHLHVLVAEVGKQAPGARKQPERHFIKANPAPRSRLQPLGSGRSSRIGLGSRLFSFLLLVVQPRVCHGREMRDLPAIQVGPPIEAQLAQASEGLFLVEQPVAIRVATMKRGLQQGDLGLAQLVEASHSLLDALPMAERHLDALLLAAPLLALRLHLGHPAAPRPQAMPGTAQVQAQRLRPRFQSLHTHRPR